MIQRIPMNKWHKYFFDLCKVNAKQSKDPSTQVGSIIVRSDRTIAGMGWNGFPKGCDDSPEVYADREVKYQRTVHAEVNAVLNSHGSVMGMALVSWPLPPCERCAPVLINAGIARIFVLADATRRDDWLGSGEIALGMFREAGIEVYEVYNDQAE